MTDNKLPIDDNSKPMQTGSIQSTGNSSTTALGSGATFTGAWELTSHPDVMVSCKTDNTGTLYFDFSPDGVNLDSTFPATGFQVESGINEFHTAVKGARYFRIRLVNDSGAQSYLRLYTYYGTFRQGNLPINASISADADATVIRSVDSTADISLGRFGGFYPVAKFGRAPDGIQITTTDVWDLANSTPTSQIWVPPTQARIHAIVSTSTDDKGTATAGTGARTIRVYGLTSWSTTEVTEDITLNGQTPVNTTNSYVIIYRMRVLTSGNTASGSNVGTITATAATDGTVTAVIRPQVGSTAMAIYGIPSTQTLLVKDYRASINKAQGTSVSATFRLMYNPEPTTNLNTFVEIDLEGLQSDGSSSNVWIFDPYIAISGPTIVKIQALGSAADIDGTAGFNGILVDNT